MKKLRFMYALTVVATSASLLFSSCNGSNKDVDNLTNGGGTKVDDPTSLFTINGQVESSLLGSIDTIKAFDDAGNRLLGTCPVANSGSFSLQIKAQVTSADSLFANMICGSKNRAAWGWFPRTPTESERKLICISVSTLNAYKKGQLVSKLQKSKLSMIGDTIIGYQCDSRTKYVYLNEPLNITYAYPINVTTDSMSYDYKLVKGWTEISFITKWNINGTYRWNCHFSNTIPDGIMWVKYASDSVAKVPVGRFESALPVKVRP
jgi:hypothetical protein